MARQALFLFWALSFVMAAGAFAQTDDELLERASQAFREDRFDEALKDLDLLIERSPEHAEALYLLARLYTETPLQDSRRADQALQRALKLEPDNLQFLVANLQRLRTDSWNFLAERVKEIRRRELARKILKLDPENGFAHEELGISYIHDFWKYRNAIMLPILQYSQGRFSPGSLSPERMGVLASETWGLEVRPLDPREVFLGDQFDLDALDQMGVDAQDLSGRADRAYQRAILHLKRSLRADPRRRPVYDHLMKIYALKGEYREAVPMLLEMNVFFPEDPGQWLYSGLAHYRLGDLDRAAVDFERGIALLPDEARRAFENLDVILPADEQDLYAADPDRYARQFWASKDPRYLTRYNERLLEHYARLTYADLLFGVPDLNLRGWETERGRILVRYGVPRIDVVIVPRQLDLHAQDVLVDFLSAQAQDDYYGRETEAPTENLGGNIPGITSIAPTTQTAASRMFNEMNTFNVWDYGDFRFVFEDPYRNGAFRLYSPPADVMGAGSEGWINDYEIIARETFRKIPERYEYEFAGRQIDLPFVVNAFRGEEGAMDVYLHYGIPLTSYEVGEEMIRLTINTGAFIIGGDRRMLDESRRTIYGLRTDQVLPFNETNLWVNTEHLRAPAGSHEVSMEFESASGATVAVQRRNVELPDLADEQLALSDMMLAYHVEESANGTPRGPADVVRRGLSITPAPWSVFRRDGPIYLYFEVYGLAASNGGHTDYDVEILLAPKDQSGGIARAIGRLFGGKEGVSVRYNGTGSSSDDGQYQILDATDVDPGLYTLKLRLRDNVARRTVDTEKDLFIE